MQRRWIAGIGDLDGEDMFFLRKLLQEVMGLMV